MAFYLFFSETSSRVQSCPHTSLGARVFVRFLGFSIVASWHKAHRGAQVFKHNPAATAQSRLVIRVHTFTRMCV